MEIRTERLRLRPWDPADVDDLLVHADDRLVWRNLTNLFPHPYTREAAEQWTASQAALTGPTQNFAIELGGEAIGGVGLKPGFDLHCLCAEVGYWLGVRHWSRGYATESLRALTRHAFDAFPFARLEAGVLAWNPASGRVLEKAGYERESIRRRDVFKDGELIDSWLYVKLR